MTDPLLPLLKDYQWVKPPHASARRLADLETPFLPWLTFAYDRSSTFEPLEEADSEFEAARQLPSLEHLALQNLRLRPREWSPREFKLGLSRRLDLLACEGDFFSAEQILDAQFMQQAAERLNAPLLAVAVPCRGTLLAMDGTASADELGRFAAVNAMQYHRCGGAAITPLVLMLQLGQVVGLVSAD
jgi:hypothetical protein